MILPSLALSGVNCFGMPSLLASRTLFGRPLPLLEAVASSTLAPLVIVAVAAVVGAGLFGTVVVPVEGAAFVVVGADSAALVAATSFFHFFTVSFARSATFLSTCVRNLPTTIPSFVSYT